MMEMEGKTLKTTAVEAIKGAASLKELETAYKAYLGKSGELTRVLRGLAELPEAQKKAQGKQANELRDTLEAAFEARKKELQSAEITEREEKEKIDITAPGKRISKGHLHPLTHIQRQCREIFGGMGFAVAEGPEIETEHYNFDALNIPANHPARDLWDTFWIKPKNAGYLLRTQTSAMQVRYMEKNNPPLRIIVPGRIFRHEATDATHEINFYQLEGLMIGKDVSVANFKAIIEEFYSQFFEKKTTVRLRPSYFPFTEPSFEIDMKQGKSGWLEMMGAGMVHPNVLKNVGYIVGRPRRSEEGGRPRRSRATWQGFAFGMGLDRLAMMKYRIDDVRLLYSGNLQFLNQF
jgi:phenylalanyl-tRNA synthetase alpha chain